MEGVGVIVRRGRRSWSFEIRGGERRGRRRMGSCGVHGLWANHVSGYSQSAPATLDCGSLLIKNGGGGGNLIAPGCTLAGASTS